MLYVLNEPTRELHLEDVNGCWGRWDNWWMRIIQSWW